MTVFKVGDKVRIVSCKNNDMMHWVGTEDEIVASCPFWRNSWKLKTANYSGDGSPCSWDSRDLEPILNSGLDAKEEKFVKDLEDALSSGRSPNLPDFNPKPTRRKDHVSQR